MTPPPADPVPLPASLVCALNEDALDDVRTYGDSRERARLARGVAEERARVVALVREHLPMQRQTDIDCSCGWEVVWVDYVAVGKYEDHLVDLITRGDHERTLDA